MSTSTAPSARRLAANRANASKSTGPRTEAGKRVSSQNARKTPPCPFNFQLPAKFEAEWFHDALERTAGCTDTRARLLLINRCMLQAHEIRWSALERTLFDVAFDETGGCVEDASLWLAQQVAAAKGLATYHRWIARRINLVERSLSALAAQSAGVEAEAPKTMAAGAGAGAAFSELSPSDLGPESTLPISYSDSGWSFGGLTGLFTYRVGAPQPPQPPKPPKPPTIGPIRGRYCLYLRCPAAPKHPNEATPPPSDFPERPATHQSEEPQQLDLRPQSACLPQEPALLPQRVGQLQQPALLPQRVGQFQQPALLSERVGQFQQPALLSQRVGQFQQLVLPLQHSPRQCRGPVAVTTTFEPNPTHPQSDLRAHNTRTNQAPAAHSKPSLAVITTTPGTLSENGSPAISSQQPGHLQQRVDQPRHPNPRPQHRREAPIPINNPRNEPKATAAEPEPGETNPSAQRNTAHSPPIAPA